MSATSQLAKHLREVHFGGNWTVSNFKDQLKDVSWVEATSKIHSFNSIATLAYHANYFVRAALRVLQGESLNASDKFSFYHPSINSQHDWSSMLEGHWEDAEQLAILTEQLPDDILDTVFVDEKYGTYHRNLLGIIEHCHYHLGQIVLIKKLVREKESD